MNSYFFVLIWQTRQTCTFATMIYELALAEEKVKKQQIVALHLIVVFCCIITGVALALLHYAVALLPENYQHLLYAIPARPYGYGIIGTGLLLLCLLLFRTGWLLQPQVNRIVRIVELLLVLVFVVFTARQQWLVPTLLYGLIAMTVFFALYWETVSDPTQYIRVTAAGIRLPVTSRSRLIAWSETEQVIFRFGILTINCYDNRLFQWQIKSINFQKEDFRQFCEASIAAHKKTG